jgi:hypothetical protein
MTFRATRASSLVLSTLTSRLRRGRVHSSFRRTVNVLCDDMTWLSLHPPEVPLHAYCIAVEGWDSIDDGGFLGARAGASATVSDSSIMLGEDGASIDLEHTEVWQSRLEHVYGLDPARITEMSRDLSRLIAGRPTESWFLSVVDGQRRPVRKPLEAMMRAKIAATVVQLQDSWISGGLERALEAMERIVGLGTGLTPSGDDFLTGFLGASYCFAYEDRFRAAVFSNMASPLGRTSMPAFFMLKAALVGHYPEPLSNLLRMLARGGIETVKLAVDRLNGLGATSGHDMLAGVLAWFQAAGLCGVTYEARCC